MLYFPHLLVLLSLLYRPSAAVQIPLQAMHQDPLLSPQLKTRIQDISDDWKSSDLILAVVKQDSDGSFREEYASFGRNAYDPRETMFSVASNTKQFTALTVALLMEDEATKDHFPLGWRTPLKSVLPDFKLADPVETGRLTFQDALSHVSGLPRHDMMNGDIAENGREDLLHKLQYLRSSVELREAWQYNNQFYSIMALLPALLKNQSFSHYLQQNVFDRAGLTRTTFSLEQAEEWGLADGYFETSQRNKTLTATSAHFAKDNFRAFKITRGAGGIISTAQDMARWVQILLRDGQDPSGQNVVAKHILETMRTARAVTKGEADWPELGVKTYGLGFMGQSYRGHKLIEHGGDLPGYTSQIAHLPDDGLGIVLFSNDNVNGNTLHQIIKHTVLDSLLGLADIDWSGRYKKKQATEEAEKKQAKEASAAGNASLQKPLKGAEGTYRHPAYGDFVLRQFNLDDLANNDIIDLEGARAISQWIDRGSAKVQIPYGLIKADKLFAQYMLLTHESGDTYDLSMLTLVRHKDSGRRFAIGATDDGTVCIGQDGLAFGGNFYGAAKGQARPLSEPAKGEVYFERIA